LQEEHAERCRAAGMVDFIAKPIDPARLEQLLARWRRPAPARDLPPLDLVLLDDLERRVGAEKVAELLGDLLADLDRRAVRFASLASQGDWAGLRREGHILKGLAANFGLPALGDLAERLLGAARIADVANTKELADAVAAAHGTAKAALNQRLGRRAADSDH
jgi:HPt (histidine-containing phosphotransfer) domain-containing protein